MRVALICFIMAVWLAQAADVQLGFIRFHATTVSNLPSHGYLRIAKNGGVLTATGTLTGLPSSVTLYAYAQQYGDMGTQGYTGYGFAGNCLVPDPVFTLTTDGSGSVSGPFTLTGNVDLVGQQSLLGRSIVIRNTQECNVIVQNGVSHGVVGYDTPQPGDTNTASVTWAAGLVPLSLKARIFPNGAATSDFSNLRGLVAFTDLHITKSRGRTAVDGQPGTVLVYAQFTGITGTHGLHVHTTADTSFYGNLTSTGAHYNPNGVTHGFPDQITRHVGDLGNFTFETGFTSATLDFIVDHMTLSNLVGRAVIVHANADNGTNPVGFSGDRWGYGIIGAAEQLAPNGNLWDSGSFRIHATTTSAILLPLLLLVLAPVLNHVM